MILPLRKVDLMGVFVSPFALCLPLAAALSAALVAALRRLRRTALPAHLAVLDLAVFTTVLSCLVLLLGRVQR